MTRLKKYYQENVVKLLLIMFGLTTIYSVVVGLIFKISTINILANIYLQFFITFLPGLACYAFFHKKENSWLNILAISYALGYSLNIASYFLLMPFGLGIFLKYFAFVISLTSIYILVKNPIFCPQIKLNRWQEFIPVCLFTLMVAADVVIYSGTNPSPLLTGSASYFRDIQYWVNVSVGLFLNFPPQAPYLDGFILHYHYFSNIHVAFSSLVSNIDIFSLSFPLYPLTKSLLFIGGLNYLLNTFKATKWQKALLLIAICFSTGYERISVVTNFHHFHLAPFGLDIGFAFGAFFIASFTERYRESDQKLDWPLFFETLLFYAVLVGAKAPLAAVLSIFPAVICLYWLTERKYQYTLAYGIAIAVIFLIISIFCVGLFSAINQLSDAQTMKLYPIDKLIITQKFSSRYVNLLVSFAYKTFTAQPILILLYALACLQFIANWINRKLKANEAALQIALITTALISIVFSRIINAASTSEMYFMMAAYLPMAALSVNVLPPSGKNRFLSKMLMALSLGMLSIQIYFFMFAAWGGYSAVSSLQKGFQTITRQSALAPSPAELPADSIQKSDVEGLIWIRENTRKDAVIAADRAVLLADDSNRSDYFYYVLFAERQMYIEGTSMIYVLKGASDKIVLQRQQQIAALFNNSDAASQDLKADGVDYIIQTKWLTPQFQPSSELALVHSTESLNIYQLQTPTE